MLVKHSIPGPHLTISTWVTTLTRVTALVMGTATDSHLESAMVIPRGITRIIITATTRHGMRRITILTIPPGDLITGTTHVMVAVITMVTISIREMGAITMPGMVTMIDRTSTPATRATKKIAAAKKMLANVVTGSQLTTIISHRSNVMYRLRQTDIPAIVVW